MRVLSFACALWSAATVACGLASSYPQLAAARMSVGVGEAGGVPPSYAIISDYFPPGTRGTALGIYNLGPPLGQALGVAFGASIAGGYSWRSAFVSLGAVGIVTALCVWCVRARAGARSVSTPRKRRAARTDTRRKARFWSTCVRFFSIRCCCAYRLACGATQFITYAVLNFTTLFLMREKGMTLNEVAIYYALAHRRLDRAVACAPPGA